MSSYRTWLRFMPGRCYIVNDNQVDYDERDPRFQRSALTRGRLFWTAPTHEDHGWSTLRLGWQWHLKPRVDFHVALTVNDDDEPLRFFFRHPFGYCSFSLGYWAHKLWPMSRMGHAYNSERDIAFWYYEGTFWLHLWSHPHEWSSDDRWWQRRQFTFEPVRFFFGKDFCTHEEIMPAQQYTMTLSDDERYPVTLKVERTTWKRKRFPFWPLTRSIVRVEIEAPESGIPIPGKGENAWDCDDNATFSVIKPYEGSPELAIAEWVKDIQERRERYGGKNWQPRARELKASEQ